MLFHEIYGCYYAAVASILDLAVKGTLNDKTMRAAIDGRAFCESFMEIEPALKSGRWRLLCPDYTTPIRRAPSMPLTTLELRWLKSISLDRRIRLFGLNFDFLRDVEPLYLPEDYVAFDRYADGDPFDSERYAAVFKTVLQAIRQHKKIKVEYQSVKGGRRRITCDPIQMEYSQKDDKFRVRIGDCRFASILNVAGIEQCEIIGEAGRGKAPPALDQAYFVALLTDERRALERFLLGFAHFKKEAGQLSDKHYRITVYYDKSDETELVIRVLSFGPHVRIQEPESFAGLIRQRLIMQKRCGPR